MALPEEPPILADRGTDDLVVDDDLARRPENVVGYVASVINPMDASGLDIRFSKPFGGL